MPPIRRRVARSLVLVAVAALAFAQLAQAHCNEPKLHSGNIERHLSPAPSHPLVGFWKRNCSDAWGLAIDRGGSITYSIYFCGPGGCFEPGTYRADSMILGDPEYRVIAPDRMEIQGNNGWSTWNRCSHRAAPPSS